MRWSCVNVNNTYMTCLEDCQQVKSKTLYSFVAFSGFIFKQSKVSKHTFTERECVCFRVSPCSHWATANMAVAMTTDRSQPESVTSFKPACVMISISEVTQKWAAIRVITVTGRKKQHFCSEAPKSRLPKIPKKKKDRKYELKIYATLFIFQSVQRSGLTLTACSVTLRATLAEQVRLYRHSVHCHSRSPEKQNPLK